MTHIIFNEEKIELDEGQSVLSGLLDRNYEIPNSCQAGVCQSCMMQAVDGEIPPAAQAGLKDTLRAQGHFLACICQPTTPLHVVAANDEMHKSAATVTAHELLSGDVLRLKLKPRNDFDYRAGQFISIWKTASLARSYSLASVAELDDELELHIRRIANGKVSGWLHDEIKLGESLQIQAASGDCFYVPGNAEQSLLLAGTGTGLAPLVGIARDAIARGHRGEIHLIHGALRKQDLYLHQELQNMAQQVDNFDYSANVLELMNETEAASAPSLEQQVLEAAKNSEDSKVYLCGDATTVSSLKKKLFLGGMALTRIYSDPFVMAADESVAISNV